MLADAASPSAVQAIHSVAPAGVSHRQATTAAASSRLITLTSAATFIDTILSGSWTGSPRLILSTLSMPSMTWPQTVYWRLRKAASSKQMKNCELAEFGFCERAIEQVPRAWFMLENSALRSGLSEPPMPARDGLNYLPPDLPNFTSPVCAMKPSMTRWKTTPS